MNFYSLHHFSWILIWIQKIQYWWAILNSWTIGCVYSHACTCTYACVCVHVHMHALHCAVGRSAGSMLLERLPYWSCGFRSHSSQKVIWIFETHFMVLLHMQLGICLHDVIPITKKVCGDGGVEVQYLGCKSDWFIWKKVGVHGIPWCWVQYTVVFLFHRNVLMLWYAWHHNALYPLQSLPS